MSVMEKERLSALDPEAGPENPNTLILLGLDQPVWVKRESTVPWRHNARVGFRLQAVHCSDVTH